MSGIAAIYNQTHESVNERLIVKMTNVMQERGPHKQHYWYDDNVAFAHCLLCTKVNSMSEIQPSTVGGKHWITADARLDARQELISKLNAENLDLENDCTDDQLILHSYIKWGVECLDHLIGDFAFILWDSNKKSLFCATDHFGVTPLYYSKTKNGYCISNTLNTLRTHPDVSNELNTLAVADYLIARTNEDPHGTIFTDINKLAAGHFLLIDAQNVSYQGYWSPKQRKSYHRTSATQYIEEFGELLNNAVNDRVKGALGIGTHLSGGMDSTSVTAIAKEVMRGSSENGHLRAYTSAASGSHLDLETPLAIEVANALNIDHKIFKKTKESFEYEPPNSRNIFPEPYNLAFAPKPHKILNDIQGFGSVLLTGFGGDPLLRGGPLAINDVNSPHKLCFIAKQAWIHFNLFSERPLIGSNRKRVKAISRSNTQAPSWINKDLSKELELSERLYSRAMYRTTSLNSQKGMYQEGTWRRIFCWNDPGFTNIPVKVCHPFFDLRLFQYTQNLPRFPWLHRKHILRSSLDGKLPKSIIKRPKTAVPSFRALETIKKNGVPNHFYDLLKTPQLSNFVDVSLLERKLIDIQECNHYDLRGIMNSLGLAHWLLEYENTPKNIQSSEGFNNVTRIY